MRRGTLAVAEVMGFLAVAYFASFKMSERWFFWRPMHQTVLPLLMAVVVFMVLVLGS